MALTDNDRKKRKQSTYDNEKTYDFRFSENEYWAIYEPHHQQYGGVWFHSSTRLIFISFALSLAGFIVSMFLPKSFGTPLVFVFMIALIVLSKIYGSKSLNRVDAKQKIKAYYESCRNGISVTISKSSLNVKIGTSSTVYPWSACIQARIEDKFIQIDLADGTFVLIPIGKEDKPKAKDLKAHISEISNELWGKQAPS